MAVDAGTVCVVRVSLWSVAKIAAAFWTGAGIVLAAAVLFAWQLLAAMGIVGNVEAFVGELVDDRSFRFAAAPLLAGGTLALSAFVLAATTLTIVAAALYNLLSPLTGGIELGVARPEPAGEPAAHVGDEDREDASVAAATAARRTS